MNLLCSDNAFHSRGVGVERPQGRCGQWNSPGPEVEPLNPQFWFQKQLLDKTPGCTPHLWAVGILLTAQGSQPGTIHWAQRQPGPGLLNAPAPCTPAKHADWQIFPFLCYPPPFIGPTGMGINWHFFAVIFLSFNLIELSILAYDYWLSEIHSYSCY